MAPDSADLTVVWRRDFGGDEPGMSETNRGPVRVLLVDKNPAMNRTLVEYLDCHHLRAASVSGPLEVVRVLADRAPSLVLLQLRRGHDNGLDLLREIQFRSSLPVIVIADDAFDEVDRVVALETGADDCLSEPFSLRELVARIRAVLRRRDVTRPAPRSARWSRYQFGDWRLDERTRKLTAPNGSVVALRRSEYALLVAFLDAPQRPLSREYLLQATRARDDAFDRSIDVRILRLRRKIESDPAAPRIIQTERSIGYVFALPVERL